MLSDRITRCIDHYLEKYDVILEDVSYNSTDLIEGSLRIHYNSKHSNLQKIGHILYAIDKPIKNLHINSIYFPKSKNKPSIKFTKILLAYLLDKYRFDIETSTLMAKPGEYRRGQEFCLLCIYQELGYELSSKKKIDKYLKKCSIPNNNGKETCILCICQKNTDKLEDLDLSRLYVDMKALLPNLNKIVTELSNEIC